MRFFILNNTVNRLVASFNALMFHSVLAMLLSFSFTQTGGAQQKNAMNSLKDVKPVAPGIRFTKIQDLNSKKQPENRPVKNKWAVVIGIDKFMEKPLNNGLHMDRAARDFYNYLVDPAAGRFEPDHVKLLVNNEATRQGVLATIGSSWLGKVAGPDDLVFIFVSTHGFPAADGHTYLCTQNTVLDNIFATGISMRDFMQTLRDTIASDRIVVVLQACYSGAAELKSGAKALFHFYNVDLDKYMLGRGYVILSSSKPNQITWGDIFSRNLIKVLRQDNGLIPINKAFEIARERTEYDTTHNCSTCKLQTPVMKSEWMGRELILGTPPANKITGVPQAVKSYLAAEAHYMQANNLMISGRTDEAIDQYKQAIAADPKYADPYNDYGSALTLKQDWQGAASCYKQALELKPNDELYHANYARVLAKLGKDDESLEELTNAYKLNSKDRVVLTALADKCRKDGNFAKASLYLKEALALYPHSADLHDRLSFILAQEASNPGSEIQLDLALRHAQEAVKLDQSCYSARLNLGSILLLKGDTKGAENAYREALKLDRAKPDGYFLLSSVLEQSNDLLGAKEALHCFLKVCPREDSRLQEARQHLTELEQAPTKPFMTNSN